MTHILYIYLKNIPYNIYQQLAKFYSLIINEIENTLISLITNTNSIC